MLILQFGLAEHQYRAIWRILHQSLDGHYPQQHPILSHEDAVQVLECSLALVALSRSSVARSYGAEQSVDSSIGIGWVGVVRKLLQSTPNSFAFALE